MLSGTLSISPFPRTLAILWLYHGVQAILSGHFSALKVKNFRNRDWESPKVAPYSMTG